MAETEQIFSIASLNIWHDQSNWSDRQSYILDVYSKLSPDVICLQEVLQNSKLVNQAQTMAEQLGYHFFFGSADEPTDEKRFGNAILTKHPVLEMEQKKLEPYQDYRVVVRLRIQWNGKPVSIYCTHLHYGYDDENVRMEQVQDLNKYIHQTAYTDPVFLAGDFNAGPKRKEIQWITKYFQDAFSILYPGADGVTWDEIHSPHVKHSHIDFQRIDYIFFKKNTLIHPQKFKILFAEPNNNGVWGSDHYGVFGEFVISN